jgi:PhzF family phenazine biosynthesis protein
MYLPIFQIDVFTSSLFKGNPAAVVLLPHWINDALLQAIAAENNLAETAFIVPNGDVFEIRWFTPVAEVALCGHATLASAYVIFNELDFRTNQVHFLSRFSGDLWVTKNEWHYELNLPLDEISEVKNYTNNLWTALGKKPDAVYKGKSDYLFIYQTPQDIKQLNPDFKALKSIDARGVIVTAPGNNTDFVSRFFAPQIGIDEDPVTGSAHTTLLPYWSKRLDKSKLSAAQLSERGGLLFCELKNQRAYISGEACLYLRGEISVPETDK